MNLGQKISNGFTSLGQKLKATFSPQLGQKVANAIKSGANAVSQVAGSTQTALNTLASNPVIKSIDPLGVTQALGSTAGAVKNVSNIVGAGTNAIEKLAKGDTEGASNSIKFIGNQTNDLLNNASSVGKTAMKVLPLIV